MRGVFTNAAITMMVRERIMEIRDALCAKQRANGSLKPIEQRILYLAHKAAEIMNAPPNVPSEHLPGLFRNEPRETVSKFLIMGSLGPAIPAWSQLNAEGQDWAFNVLHRGTRDPNREDVSPPTVSFPLKIWDGVRTAIDSSSRNDDAKKGAKKAMRAYTLGHLCHVAADVFTAPYIDDVEAHLRVTGADKKHTREEVEAKLDFAVKRMVFESSTLSQSLSYNRWWPSPGEVPSEFYGKYADAASALFTPIAGFSDFETGFPSDTAPMSGNLIDDGYSSFRHIMETGYDWTMWNYLLALVWMIVPFWVSVPCYGLLPTGQHVHEADPPAPAAPINRERGWWEIVALQYGVAGLPQWLYMVLVGALTSRSFGLDTGIGIGVAIAVLAFSIALLAMIGDSNASPEARWTCLIIPIVLQLAYSCIYMPIRGVKTKYNKLLAWIFPIHIIGTLLSLGFIAIPPFGKFLRGRDNDNNTGHEGAAVGMWFLFTFILFGLLLLLCFLLERNILTLPAPADEYALDPHYVRLYDDHTLMSGEAAPTLRQRIYPPGRRKLMKVWKEGGSNDLYIRPLGDQLEFRITATGAGTPPRTDNADVRILTPLAPTTLRDLAKLIERSFAAAVGTIKTEVYVPTGEDWLLPGGNIFADHSEADLAAAALDRTVTPLNQADRLNKVNDWIQIGADAEHAFDLYHSLRARQAVRFGIRGQAFVADEVDGTAVNAPGNVTLDGPGTGPTQVLGDAASRFLTTFNPGDRMAIGAQQQVVLSIQDDHHLTLQFAFTAGLPAHLAAGAAFQRVPIDRRLDSALFAGPVAVVAMATVSSPPLLSGTGFDQNLMPGDVIRVIPPAPAAGAVAPLPEERTVVAINPVGAAFQVQTDLPFSLVVGTGAGNWDYRRVGTQTRDGYRFLRVGVRARDPASNFNYNFQTVPGSDLVAGDTIMDAAADLGTIFCLGGVSHLFEAAELGLNANSSFANCVTAPATLSKVFQVFRNWNLDRRRVNEWRMIFAGGATSEKGTTPAAADSMMHDPAGAAWTPFTGGEATANQLGWVPLLRKWIDMAQRRGQDPTANVAFRPGDPSNLDLSKGMAFLFDLPDPTGT